MSEGSLAGLMFPKFSSSTAQVSPCKGPFLLPTWRKAEPGDALGSYIALGEKKCSSEGSMGTSTPLHASARCLQTTSGAMRPQGCGKPHGSMVAMQKPLITAAVPAPHDFCHKKGVFPGLGSTAPRKGKGLSCALGCVGGLNGYPGWMPAQLCSAGVDQVLSGPQLFGTWHFPHGYVFHFLTRAVGNGKLRRQRDTVITAAPCKTCLSKSAAVCSAARAASPLSRRAKGLSLGSWT